MTMATIFRDLPKDLVEEEILCHIPATYLKRLKSTCKPWHRLVNGDSRFARKHTDIASKQLLVLLLKDYRIGPAILDLLHGSVEFKSELSLVDSQSMSSAQFDIAQAFHCDGLLLCTSIDRSRFVVWNPFTGETRWFQSSYRGVRSRRFFAFGYYQEDNDKRYKILSFAPVSKDCDIYEFSSDSWRTLHDITPSRWKIKDFTLGVSLKGNSYWLAIDAQDNLSFIRNFIKKKDNLSLLKFNFQTEKFVLVPLPYQCPVCESRGLSVVREEKLSVLLQRDVTSKTEIWVTNKIDDESTTQVVSWSKVLALDLSPDLQICDDVNFLLDEEKKVVMMRVRWVDPRRIPIEEHPEGRDMLYTIREDDEVTQVKLETDGQCVASIFNYVPSLVQIKQAGSKRKRGDLSTM